MKRLMIGAAVMAVTLALFAATDIQPNCLVNGDFEAAINPDGTAAGWKKLPKNFKIVKNAGENGSTGLVYENDDHKFYAFPVQKIKVVPGATYKISARVFNERIESPIGSEGGARIILETQDANGKYLAPIQCMFTTEKGKWVDIAMQGPIPTNTAKASFSPFVSRGFVGKVHFDSLRVERVITRPIYGLYSSAYRNEIAEEPVDFVAGLEFTGANMKASDVTPVFIVPKANGGEREMAPTLLDEEQAKITLAPKDLPTGKSKIRFELRSKDTGAVVERGADEVEIERFAKLPPRKVRFDRRQRLIVDGKPFFPLGMYWCEKVTEKELDIFCEGSFNCVMNYTWPTKPMMDAYHKRGLKVIYALHNAFEGMSFKTAEEANKRVEEIVRLYKDHPAFLAWYVNDERGLDFMPQLLARQEYLHRADPDHPTWAVMYQLGILKYYVDTCDAIGTDPYPIGGGNRLEMVAEWTDAARKSNYGIRPIWMVPQAFDWGLCWKNKNDRTRYPELDELKNMYWTAIACGANGIIAYNYTHLRDMEWKTPKEKTWPATAETSHEISRFIPVLLMGDEPPAIKSDNKMVRVRAYREGDVRYALVVNNARKPTKVKVTVGGGCDEAREELGPKPKCTAPGVFEVEMPPMGVAMWKLIKTGKWLHLSHVHRGGGKQEAPDNTLETFRWCWEHGSAVECDCRRTKDGVGIMLHDKTLARTGRGIDKDLANKQVSKELTWDQIKNVDVGSYQGKSFAGQHVPTIEAVFAAMTGKPTWLCMVDEKGAGPQYIAEKAKAAGVADQVYYTGNSHANIMKWNEMLPGGRSLLWIGAWPQDHGPEERARADAYFREKMAKLRANDFRFITAVSLHSYYDPKDSADPFVPSSDVLRECIDEFHEHGIAVCSIPFMGGELEETYFKLWELGCDGFSTDYPSVMFKVIDKLKKGQAK